MTNLYDILGVSRDASQEEIDKRHRDLGIKLHPDKNPNDPEAEEKYKAINAAYQTLKQPEKRREYDRGLLEIDKREKDIGQTTEQVSEAQPRPGLNERLREMNRSVYGPGIGDLFGNQVRTTDQSNQRDIHTETRKRPEPPVDPEIRPTISRKMVNLSGVGGENKG